MYQQQQKTPFCALTMYLRPTGNKSPKFEYKADAKSLFTCSLTKKKYKLSQIDEWYHTEGVQNFVRQGYTGKWYAKTQDIETPNKYDQGTTQMVLSFIMTKPYKPQPNVDGMKPIGQAIPQVEQGTTQMSKPQSVTTRSDGLSSSNYGFQPNDSFDDDLPPF
ncbi:hypothetical protein [uncultured Mediterranean phage uvMED]|nr:hypothetical protein [uncultured Mediterranean phage uvMED]